MRIAKMQRSLGPQVVRGFVVRGGSLLLDGFVTRPKKLDASFTVETSLEGKLRAPEYLSAISCVSIPFPEGSAYHVSLLSIRSEK